MCVFKDRYFLRNLFNNKLLIFLFSAKSFYSTNKSKKCNIWISNTAYIFDYNSISFHDNQLLVPEIINELSMMAIAPHPHPHPQSAWHTKNLDPRKGLKLHPNIWFYKTVTK